MPRHAASSKDAEHHESSAHLSPGCGVGNGGPGRERPVEAQPDCVEVHEETSTLSPVQHELAGLQACPGRHHCQTVHSSLPQHVSRHVSSSATWA